MGSPGDNVMAVLSDNVRISLSSSDGRELLLAILFPGEFFGEISLLDGKERTADATAQLEIARRIDPRNKAVYPPLAAAYQRSGQGEKVKEALAALAGLNKDDAERTRTADGGHAGYVSGKKNP